MREEILSSQGRVKVGEIVIPPYPKLLHLCELEQPMYAQPKVDGYNVRIAKTGRNWTAFLRGGMIDKKTNELVGKYLGEKLERFFRVYPDLVLVTEIIGMETMANYKGDKEFDYFVFDIMNLKRPEKTRFLNAEVVKNICKTFDLNFIGNLGLFSDLKKLKREMKKLPEHYEGVVLKSVDGNIIYKFKWEDDREYFKDRVKEKKRFTWKPKPEEIIINHLMQGYAEPELGLKSGFTDKEFKEYLKLLELLGQGSKEDIGKKADRIVDWLMEVVERKGKFDDKFKECLRKEFKKRVGKEIGKRLKRV